MIRRRRFLAGLLAAPAVVFLAPALASGAAPDAAWLEATEATDEVLVRCYERWLGCSNLPPRPAIEVWLMEQETHSPRATLMLVNFWNAGSGEDHKRSMADAEAMWSYPGFLAAP